MGDGKGVERDRAQVNHTRKGNLQSPLLKRNWALSEVGTTLEILICYFTGKQEVSTDNDP